MKYFRLFNLKQMFISQLKGKKLSLMIAMTLMITLSLSCNENKDKMPVSADSDPLALEREQRFSQCDWCKAEISNKEAFYYFDEIKFYEGENSGFLKLDSIFLASKNMVYTVVYVRNPLLGKNFKERSFHLSDILPSNAYKWSGEGPNPTNDIFRPKNEYVITPYIKIVEFCSLKCVEEFNKHANLRLPQSTRLLGINSFKKLNITPD